MNKSILMGRLTKDTDLRYTSGNNTAVASFTLAVNRRFAKEGQPQADFINVVAWGKTAEFVGKYFTKGLQVVVVGRIQTRTWDDNEGKKHYVTEVVAEETYFADSKRTAPIANKPDSSEPTVSESGDGFYPPMEDDDLPFNGGLDFP
ncbi:single-strand binding protein [Ruminiclostridium papyrosolvens DSM 2782]|uniref:Single-stranded DNA-binding protein n=1 Tax=Ruminiclostridium papyrosolvens DSM 2782 TaxID=588581 RepID=F1TEC1_9FIRM|nr:single-stranded DNA-binding protein [Ruminiclostridium papyrosolvens]EGD47087.1 single-strand binding protein [Ruminiclostridium papyrosolvens DSM 2782]WES36029.1 single-stranded DNA-binding protein [Ruminiclostridium papyrosolvens DSM 2782]WES36127.1 single-stranded DNA-binding protein [Ruminiclostridium papyrosolvens DSM 2782]